jgi:hypothetical protein
MVSAMSMFLAQNRTQNSSGRSGILSRPSRRVNAGAHGSGAAAIRCNAWTRRDSIRARTLVLPSPVHFKSASAARNSHEFSGPKEAVGAAKKIGCRIPESKSEARNPKFEGKPEIAKEAETEPKSLFKQFISDFGVSNFLRISCFELWISSS